MNAKKWFFGYLKRYLGKIFLGLFLLTIASVLALATPYISGILVDLITDKQYAWIVELLVILVVVTVIKSGLRFSYAYLFETASQDLIYQLRSDVYKRLLQQDFSFYNRNRTGDLMARQTGDMDAIRHFVAWVIYGFYENCILFVLSLIMIFSVNIKLAWMMVIVVPLTAIAIVFQFKQVSPAFDKIRDAFSALNTFVQENISGNRVVKAFSTEKYEIEKFKENNDNFMDVQLQASGIWQKYAPIFDFLSGSVTIILFVAGGILAIRGELTIGDFVKINGYLWMLTGPLHTIAWVINDISNFNASIQKIYKTIQQEPKVKKRKHAIGRKELKGDVCFQNVSYLVDNEDVLQNISFHIKAGQKVGILGSTGAGKSTVMNLLCRFYDATEGEVLVDGINVKDLDLYDLRDNIGMAMQDVFLFSDTIEGNIAYGKPDCTFEDVKWAAKVADAETFINKLPEGYDTIVGERGMGLSGGQKQRISLARALLKKPSILILDDTTSAVDMETEVYIQNQLKSMSADITTFIIAYRISSIKDADIILVLEDGHLVEVGNHEELLSKNGYYAQVYEHQYETTGIRG